jgi:hypothetical protein
MKLTPNAAMRARDVSRPRAEHLAEAEAAEASAAAGSRARTGDAANQARDGNKAKTPHPPQPQPSSQPPSQPPPAGSGGERAGRPRFPRRRRGRGSR